LYWRIYMTEKEQPGKLFGQNTQENLTVRDRIAIEMAPSLQETIMIFQKIAKTTRAGKMINDPTLSEKQKGALKSFSQAIPSHEPGSVAEVAELRAYLGYIQADLCLQIREGFMSVELQEVLGLKKDAPPGTQERRWDHIAGEL